jgi:cell division septation protein DedD
MIITSDFAVRQRFSMNYPSLFMLAGVLIATPALADTKKGDVAWVNGDYATAINEWRPQAIGGDSDAQVHLGQAYQLGRGVPVDLKLAEDWFRRAAQQGSDDGRDNYGLVLFQTGKRAEALPYVEDAAGHGNARAQYILGTALFNGDMIAKDWPRAYAMMTRASVAGIPAAKNSLVQMDKYIPLDQRKRGLALAGAFEIHASGKTASGALVTDRPITGIGDVSRSDGLPGAARPHRPDPVTIPSDLAPVAAKPEPVKQTAKPSIAKSVPEPALSLSGSWRVQFGAYSDEVKARALWPSLRNRVPALRPFRAFAIKAGPLTRLRAGPLVNRAAAERLCASVRASGQACMPVAP